jgi:hypothetical protein
MNTPFRVAPNRWLFAAGHADVCFGSVRTISNLFALKLIIVTSLGGYDFCG